MCCCVDGCQALKQLDLRDRTQTEIDVWMEEARVDAIIGSCALSLPSVKSGTRCYMAFVGACAYLRTMGPEALRVQCRVPDATGRKGKGYFPPVLETLLVDVVPVPGDLEQLPGLREDLVSASLRAD